MKQLIQNAISSHGVDDLLGGRDSNHSVLLHVCNHPPKHLVDKIPALESHYHLTTPEENNCANTPELKKATNQKKSRFAQSLKTIRQQETRRLFPRVREQPIFVVSQIQSLANVASQAVGGISELKESISDMTKGISDMKETALEQSGQIQAHSSQMLVLKESVSDLKETAREQSVQIQAHSSQISDLKKTAQGHGGRISNLENTEQVQDTLLANLQGQVQNLTFQVGGLAPMSNRVGGLAPRAAPRKPLVEKPPGSNDFNRQLVKGAMALQGPRK